MCRISSLLQAFCLIMKKKYLFVFQIKYNTALFPHFSIAEMNIAERNAIPDKKFYLRSCISNRNMGNVQIYSIEISTPNIEFINK